MAIEQTSPDKPRFGVVVLLFFVSIVVILVLSVLFVDFDGKHITFRQHSRFHTQLIQPGVTSQIAA